MSLDIKRRLGAAALVSIILIVTAPLRAEVNLEWRPASLTAHINDTVEIGLFAVYTGVGTSSITAMDVLPVWDPNVLQLLGVNNNGPYAWLSSGFPGDSGLDGLNNTWTDGNAKYTALAQFQAPAQATTQGLKVTTFRFKALSASPGTTLSIAASLGLHSRTVVYGNSFPGEEITGTMGSAMISVCGASATGDMDGSGHVDGADIDEFVRAVLASSSIASDVCPGDFDGDGMVGVGDVSGMVAALLGP